MKVSSPTQSCWWWSLEWSLYCEHVVQSLLNSHPHPATNHFKYICPIYHERTCFLTWVKGCVCFFKVSKLKMNGFPSSNVVYTKKEVVTKHSKTKSTLLIFEVNIMTWHKSHVSECDCKYSQTICIMLIMRGLHWHLRVNM